MFSPRNKPSSPLYGFPADIPESGAVPEAHELTQSLQRGSSFYNITSVRVEYEEGDEHEHELLSVRRPQLKSKLSLYSLGHIETVDESDSGSDSESEDAPGAHPLASKEGKVALLSKHSSFMKSMNEVRRIVHLTHASVIILIPTDNPV